MVNEMADENPLMSHVRSSLSSITFITTYQCTAACKECCFECSPQLDSGKLTYDFMRRVIDDAIMAMPNLQVVVFSGGECFMLKEHLYETIAYATFRGLRSRCVTNGYWGITNSKAKAIAEILRVAGLSEINISTGLDHQQWVPFSSVVQCSMALVEKQIPTLITIEKDSSESSCWYEANDHIDIKRLLKQEPKLLTLMCNAWMTFAHDSISRQKSTNDAVDAGCHQLFSNLVVTPHKVVSACCGLTFEHIPEMRLGKFESKPLSGYIDDLTSDFLKLWIHLDGPRQVARAILGVKHNQEIENAVHICEACATLHQNLELRAALKERYHEFVPDVTSRYLMGKFLAQMTSVIPAQADAVIQNEVVSTK